MSDQLALLTVEKPHSSDGSTLIRNTEAAELADDCLTMRCSTAVKQDSKKRGSRHLLKVKLRSGSIAAEVLI